MFRTVISLPEFPPPPPPPPPEQPQHQPAAPPPPPVAAAAAPPPPPGTVISLRARVRDLVRLVRPEPTPYE